MTNGDVLRAAAEHIRRYGHNQNAAGGLGQPTCLIGSVGAALEMLRPQGDVDWHGVEMDGAWQAIDTKLQDRTVEWNRTATAEQAIALLLDLAFDEDLKAAATEHKPELMEPAQEYKPALMGSRA